METQMFAEGSTFSPMLHFSDSDSTQQYRISTSDQSYKVTIKDFRTISTLTDFMSGAKPSLSTLSLSQKLLFQRDSSFSLSLQVWGCLHHMPADLPTNTIFFPSLICSLRAPSSDPVSSLLLL